MANLENAKALTNEELEKVDGGSIEIPYDPGYPHGGNSIEKNYNNGTTGITTHPSLPYAPAEEVK